MPHSEERLEGRLRPCWSQIQIAVLGKTGRLRPALPQYFAVAAGLIEIERAQLRIDAKCASLDLIHIGELMGL